MSTVTDYQRFLASKQHRGQLAGVTVSPAAVHPRLYGWQAQIVTWAARTGRAAIWADTGLGKTGMQLEWARLSGRRALVVAPLAVCDQTVAEAAALGLPAAYVRGDPQAPGPGIWVTNYERITRFDPAGLDAVVLDEASILKHCDSKTRAALTSHFAGVPRRLACTATPAPNDVEELTGQAEFLGIMPRAEMLAAYFVHDAAGWRLKGHARGPMFAWLATWAVALRRPSDLGWPDDGYQLPPVHVSTHLVPDGLAPAEGTLFPDLGGVGGRARVRAATVQARCARAAALAAAEPGQPWVLWCGLNAEAATLTRLVPGAVNLHGTLPTEAKAAILRDFAAGTVRVLVTKPSICGFGLNWQHCARMAFVGLSDSYESYYQAIRRCHRYGQARPVHAHIVLSETEAPITAAIARKQREAAALTDDLVRQMRAQPDRRAA